MAWEWKPGGLQKNDFIFQYVTAQKWNNLVYYLLDNGFIADSAKEILFVNKGDLLTAYKFNLMAQACRADIEVKKDDPITAEAFNALVANL